MRLIKQNPALAVGIGLPVAVVVLFALATLAPSLLVAPPQYDALFVIDVPAYSPQEPASGEIRFAVDNGHLKAYRRFDPKRGCCGPGARLYLFEARRERTHEVFIAPAPPPANPTGAWEEFTVPETAGMRLDPATTSPDGYEFGGHPGGYNGDIWPLMGGSYGRNRLIIAKQGREITISLPDSNPYMNNPRFLGWVIGRDGK